MNRQKMTTFGFLMADKINGPFEFHLMQVRAIRMKKLLSQMDVMD